MAKEHVLAKLKREEAAAAAARAAKAAAAAEAEGAAGDRPPLELARLKLHIEGREGGRVRGAATRGARRHTSLRAPPWCSDSL